MTIFDVLTLIGGLCLFLFGMDIMGQALERRAGNQMQTILGKLTSNRFAGLLTGLGVTSVIQSSSATTVMVVGFVNSGLMTLRQSINVIMGANIGTTVTAWILSLGGISSDNIFMKLLKPTSFTPVLALVGIIYYMFFKSTKKQDTGMIFLGFATLMFGMDTMSSAVAGLKDVPAFCDLFLMFKNPILGVLVGAILTAIIQSSSASVGILQALAATGAVSYGAAIPIIMGQNIGTCITAILSCFGTNRNAKRAAMVHLSFNVIGTTVLLTVFSIAKAIFEIPLLDSPATLAGIAVAHSLFNVICTTMLFPASGLLEKLAIRLVPDAKEIEENAELDKRLLATPAIALERCRELALEMGKLAIDSMTMSIGCLAKFNPEHAKVIREIESKTDHYEDIIGSYLVELSHSRLSAEESATSAKILKIIGDYERIADHSENILESAEEMKNKDYSFSENAKAELSVITSAIDEILGLSYNAVAKNDLEIAKTVEPLEETIDDLKEKMRNSHIMRLQNGECTIETGFVWADVLTNLERVSDHCSNIAGIVIDSKLFDFNTHKALEKIKQKKDFEEKYLAYSGKYSL